MEKAQVWESTQPHSSPLQYPYCITCIYVISVLKHYNRRNLTSNIATTNAIYRAIVYRTLRGRTNAWCIRIYNALAGPVTCTFGRDVWSYIAVTVGIMHPFHQCLCSVLPTYQADTNWISCDSFTTSHTIKMHPYHTFVCEDVLGHERACTNHNKHQSAETNTSLFSGTAIPECKETYYVPQYYTFW